MNLDDLNAELHKIDEQWRKDKSKAILNFCLANNTVSIGDTITDGDTTIVVDRISASTLGKYQCVYHGKRLTKSGSFYKNGDRSCIIQGAIKENANV